MKLEKKVFELYHGKYTNLSDLAQAMEISVSQVYRVRQGNRRINGKFIIGTIKAFPEYGLSSLFHFVPEESQDDYR